MGLEDLFGGSGGLFGGEGSQWTIILPLLIFVVISIFMRKRKTEGSDTEVASSLLIDINENLKQVGSFEYQKRPKIFRAGSWQRNSAKLGFLEPELMADLTNVFSMIESVNEQIVRAKKEKSDIYLSGIDVHRLEEPLSRSRDGLQEWLKTHMQQQGPDAGRRGCMGGGLGG